MVLVSYILSVYTIVSAGATVIYIPKNRPQMPVLPIVRDLLGKD